MKILHCSDIHLGKRPFGDHNFGQIRYEDYFRAFSSVVDVAIRESVGVIMIAGDLFDKKDISPDILRRAEEIFQKAYDSNIKTLLIEGNHDNSNKFDDIDSWLHYIEEKGLATRLNYRKDGVKYIFEPIAIEGINFYGLGYPGYNIDKVISELSQVLEGENNVVMVHTAIGGSDKEYLPGVVTGSVMRELKGKAMYVAGGHFHSKSAYPAENPFFFVPGSTEYWDVRRENSESKGVYIFDSESKEHKFVEINSRKRVKGSFNYKKKVIVGDGETKDSLDEFRNMAKGLKLTGEELVVINLNILDDSYVDIRDLEEILQEEGALKGYIIPKFVNSSMEKDELEEGEHRLIEDIERDVIDSWNGFDGKFVSRVLQDLKVMQESGEEEKFFEIFDHMLEEMIEKQ